MRRAHLPALLTLAFRLRVCSAALLGPHYPQESGQGARLGKEPGGTLSAASGHGGR